MSPAWPMAATSWCGRMRHTQRVLAQRFDALGNPVGAEIVVVSNDIAGTAYSQPQVTGAAERRLRDHLHQLRRRRQRLGEHLCRRRQPADRVSAIPPPKADGAITTDGTGYRQVFQSNGDIRVGGATVNGDAHGGRAGSARDRRDRRRRPLCRRLARPQWRRQCTATACSTRTAPPSPPRRRPTLRRASPTSACPPAWSGWPMAASSSPGSEEFDRAAGPRRLTACTPGSTMPTARRAAASSWSTATFKGQSGLPRPRRPAGWRLRRRLVRFLGGRPTRSTTTSSASASTRFGARIGSQFTVNTGTDGAGGQYLPHVAALADGRLVVEWHSAATGEIRTQIIDPRDGLVTGTDDADALYGHTSATTRSTASAATTP